MAEHSWKDVFVQVKNQVKQDNVSLLAAGLAYYTILAIFPAIIAAVALWGIVAEPAELESQINSLLQPLPADAREAIEPVLTNATSRAGAALSLGFVVSLAIALYSASGGMAGMIQGANIAYDEDETRRFFRRRGLALVLTLGAIVVGLVAIGLVVVLPAILEDLGLGPVGEFLARWLRWPVLALLVIVALGVVYRYAPDRENARFRWVSPGAIIATVLWLIGSGLFSLYVTNFGNYDATYGTVAGIIILLLWLFLTGFIVLLGAEINAELERQTRRDTTTGEERELGARRAEAADTVGEPAG